jgi:hypothetical protein
VHFVFVFVFVNTKKVGREGTDMEQRREEAEE